jgi:hypothetical protein
MAQPWCADLDWLILSQRNTGETSGGEHHTITDTQRIGEWCPEGCSRASAARVPFPLTARRPPLLDDGLCP